jgi:hypothetical protein
VSAVGPAALSAAIARSGEVMALMRPPKPLSTTSETPEGLHIVIRNHVYSGNLPFGLGCGLFGLLLLTCLLRTLFGPQILDMFVPETALADWVGWVSALVVCSLLILVGVGGLLWQLSGRRVIRISEDGLAIRTERLGLGWSRKFKRRRVLNLRCSPADELIWRQAAPGWAVVDFDYGAKRYFFGHPIPQAEADLIVAAVLRRFPDMGPRIVR